MKYINEEYILTKNLYPIKQIVNDIKAGIPKKIAFLGASVTYGESVKRGREFPAVLAKKWKEVMNTEYVPEVINASKSGTFSGNGLFAMDDLLEKKPDLVFLDYSVNDPGQAYLAETFEALTYRFLTAGCAVAILFFCNERGSCTKGAMTRVARHYHLPIIDIGKLVMEQISDGDITWDDFALDYVHPNNEGHEYIADNLFRLFQIAETCDDEACGSLPEESCFSGVFRDLQFIRELEYSEEGIELSLEFSSLLIEYTQKPEFSDYAMDVYVDGEFIRTIYRYSDFSWNNRVVHSIFEGYENSRHNIKIVPAEKCTNSKEEWQNLKIQLAIGHFSEDSE